MMERHVYHTVDKQYRKINPTAVEPEIRDTPTSGYYLHMLIGVHLLKDRYD
jgi:hypothetical protein